MLCRVMTFCLLFILAACDPTPPQHSGSETSIPPTSIEIAGGNPPSQPASSVPAKIAAFGCTLAGPSVSSGNDPERVQRSALM